MTQPAGIPGVAECPATTFAAVGGFLGAGKTTTLAALATVLEGAGHRVAIVTNDQGDDLVDTQLAADSTSRVAEVTGGCFCCRFEDLEAVVDRLIRESAADVILAEAVGSCTDLQATVVRPLRALHGDQLRVAPLITVVDPARFAELARSLPLADGDLAYLFDRQLADSDVIAVNKIDLFTAHGMTERAALRSNELRQRYPHASIVEYSARTGHGLDNLARRVVDVHAAADRDLSIDYDRYAAAEADLAWLNQRIVVGPAASGATFSPAAWGSALLTTLAGRARRNGWSVGHAKVLVADAVASVPRWTKLSLVSSDTGPMLDRDGGAITHGRAYLNARIACRPAQLDQAVRDAIAVADAAAGTACTIATSSKAFAPAYPRPTHRLAADLDREASDSPSHLPGGRR